MSAILQWKIINNLRTGYVMRKHVHSLILATVLITLSSVSQAEHKSYGDQVGEKALNGVANIGTAVLEIPKSIINTINESNFVYGVAGGILKGILNTGGRIIVGVTDLVTAPLPTKPIVHPVRVWDDFDAETSYGKVFRQQHK